MSLKTSCDFRIQLIVNNQQLEIGVLQNALQLFALQPRVEDDGHRADLLRGKIAQRNGGRIGQQHSDPIALADAFLLQVAASACTR